MTDIPQVFRPAVDIVYTGGGGSITFLDADGTPRTVVGTQPDGSVTSVDVNAPGPAAISTPVLTPAQLAMTVAWDGLMAADRLGPTLNSNPDFESTVDPWVKPDGGTIAVSTTEFHSGAQSLACTPNGTDLVMSAASELIGVTAGVSYEATAWVWSTDAVVANFTLAIDWYDGDRQYLSSDGTAGSLSATTWVQVITTATAPSGAAFAQIHPALAGTPTDVFYLDDLTLVEADSTVPADFDHVEVHVSDLDGFTASEFTLYGTLRKAGTFPVASLTAGTTYYAVLVGVNTSGVAGDASAQASATPDEVVASDIVDGIVTTVKLADDAVTNAKIADTAVDANKLADGSVDAAKILDGTIGTGKISFDARDIGGITTTIAGTAPSSPLANDIWIDSSNGYRLNQWSGSAWTAIQYGTGALSAGSVTAAVIAANTITASQIATDTITASQIAAGAIGASELAANSVIAGKIAAGIVDTTALAANAVTAAKIAANTITASQIAANTITASQIAAGAIDATKLVASLVLSSTIIAGDAAAARVQIDGTSGIALYDQDGDTTTVLGSDGNAVFNGSSVSANEVDAETVVISSPTDGGLFIYGSSGSPLNSNPDFATGTTHWSATATTISYSAAHPFNGHDTMKALRVGGPATVLSDAFNVTAGDTYQLSVQALAEAPAPPIYAQIEWLNSSSVVIGKTAAPTASPTSFTTALTAAGDAPTGTVTAQVRIGFTVTPTGGQSTAFYVAYAAVTAANVVTTLTNDAGTDELGNAYPAGLQTSAIAVGGFKWGRTSPTTQTDSTGVVTVTHGLNGTPTTAVVTPTGSAVANFRPFIKSLTSTTFVVGWIDTATYGVVSTTGHQVPFCWFAAV